MDKLDFTLSPEQYAAQCEKLTNPILTRLGFANLIQLSDDELDIAIANEFGLKTKYVDGSLCIWKPKKRFYFHGWQPIWSWASSHDHALDIAVHIPHEILLSTLYPARQMCQIWLAWIRSATPDIRKRYLSNCLY